MKRHASCNLQGRALAAFAVAGAVAITLVNFTCDGALAAKGNGRPVRGAILMYEIDYFAPGTTYGSTEDVQRIGYPGSLVPVELTDLKFHSLIGPGPWLELPAPGTPPVEVVVEQRVAARLEFGPGSDPFWIDSFFDIAYRVANTGSSPLGPFSVEVLAGELKGENPLYEGEVKLRVNPLASSRGEHRIVPNADGATFTLTSFFDVWTEISLGDGPYVAADEEFRVGYVPEPASAAIALVSFACLCCLTRCLRKNHS